jgi:hypothetical protein
MAVQVGFNIAEPGRHLNKDGFHNGKRSIKDKIKLDRPDNPKLPIGREPGFWVSPEVGVIG